jgi:hypothetical protein
MRPYLRLYNPGRYRHVPSQDTGDPGQRHKCPAGIVGRFLVDGGRKTGVQCALVNRAFRCGRPVLEKRKRFLDIVDFGHWPASFRHDPHRHDELQLVHGLGPRVFQPCQAGRFQRVSSLLVAILVLFWTGRKLEFACRSGLRACDPRGRISFDIPLPCALKLPLQFFPDLERGAFGRPGRSEAGRRCP